MAGLLTRPRSTYGVLRRWPMPGVGRTTKVSTCGPVTSEPERYFISVVRNYGRYRPSLNPGARGRDLSTTSSGPFQLKTSRAMLTLTTLLQALFVSGIIACVTYCLMRVTAYCVLWLIELSFKPTDDLQQHADRTPFRLSPKTKWANESLHFYLR